MIGSFFSVNFMTLMILAALIVALIINREEKVPESRYFGIAIALLLVITIANTVSRWAAGDAPVPFFTSDIDRIIRIVSS